MVQPGNDKENKIPPEEQWIYDNPEILESILRGLEDAREGRISEIDLDSL